MSGTARRIVTPHAKVTYAVVVVAALITVTVATALAVDANAAVLAYAIAAIGAVALGARIFRGEGEDRAAPRAGWRMTGRPLAGYILSAVMLVEAGALALGAARSDLGLIPGFTAALLFAAASGAYISSSVRLSRLSTSPK